MTELDPGALFLISIEFMTWQRTWYLSGFRMRNSFEAMPHELEEATLVDGCSTFTAPRRVPRG